MAQPGVREKPQVPGALSLYDSIFRTQVSLGWPATVRDVLLVLRTDFAGSAGYQPSWGCGAASSSPAPRMPCAT